ncbi:TetR/AcrR family transcriptional regulator [Williamsia sterculiae]|uniref:Transcriptional regulator, TetR family n=1 Tax=Williamsia sterculiae TaxID=1344003 RepID=A0A1N7GYK8_9NOCA|nr:TetR family transcriptional regulator [Williamsia sterculiae]SIS17651.1 transcriptional regulator, TetR family [Williamsia sterculiae]
MIGVTSAATPKGLRRRARLIAAAGELLIEGGYDAVRHRAVAERADLPLASTTYYFESLEDLLVEAATHTCRDDEECIRARAEALNKRRRGAEATAEALAEVFVGPDTTRRALTNRIETVVLSTRCARLEPLLDERRKMLAGLHGDVLDKCGRVADPGRIAQLMAVEDGAVAGALADATDDVAEATRLALTDLVDVLAPVAPE